MPDQSKKGGLERRTPLRSKGGGLQRKAPLARGAGGLSQGSGLKRTGFKKQEPKPQARNSGAESGLTPSSGPRRTPIKGARQSKPVVRKPMNRKPPQRTPEEIAGRALVAARSEGLCEKCGKASGLEKAHRIARSQSGTWAASNILDLCHDCHHDNHRNPADAYEGGWHLRSGQNPLASRTLLWKEGRYDWAFLDDEGGWRWEDSA